MKICVVFAAIVAVSFGEVIQDPSLKKDLDELNAMIPEQKIADLYHYYLYVDEDVEVMSVLMSGDWYVINQLLMEQPEFKEFFDWLSIQLHPGHGNIKEMSLERKEYHKPGWKGFVEEYVALIPKEEISKFIEEKVAESGAFAEFWGRVLALKPAYEKFIRLPKVVEIVQRLEAVGFDGVQFDGVVRDMLGWH